MAEMKEHASAESTPGEITRRLQAWTAGDERAVAAIFPELYGQLQHLAHRSLMGERADHTLGTSGLISEAYLRLRGQRRMQWRSRGHFYAMAARMMRRVLVDHARNRAAAKRGAGVTLVTLEDADLVGADDSEVLAINEALERLQGVSPEQCEIVELRFFGGFSNEEVASALGISVPTVTRRWRLARAWLYGHLHPGGEDPGHAP